MKNKILNVILIGYIIVLIWLLLVPNVFRGEQTWYSNVFSYQHFVDSNLIPFRTIIMYIYCLKNGNINIDIPKNSITALIGKFFHVYANYNFNKNKDPSVDFKKDFIIYYLF